MNRLLEQADPAASVEVDRDRLRALVDDRIGIEPLARPRARPTARPWIAIAAALAVVIAVAVPTLLNHEGVSDFEMSGQVTDFPGLVAQTGLASGGVQTMAVDGDDIWVVTSLQNVLQRLSKNSSQIEETFDLDAYVEGVVAGGGYLWLFSYDDDGEVLRFDPNLGVVDLRIPLGGLPGLHGLWFDGRLFAGNDQGEYLEIASDGSVLSTTPGVLLGEGLGVLWVFDETDGSIQSVSSDGTRGEFVIPDSTPEFGDLGRVRGVGEAGGYLWLTFDEESEGVGRFNPTTGELQPLHIGRHLRGPTEHEGALWMTSYTDHLLFRVDPESGDVRRFPLPGRPGAVESLDEDLGVVLFQPGTFVRLDPAADLVEMGPEVAATYAATDGGRYTLACTLGGADVETVQRVQVDGDFTGLEPTVILEGPSWLGGGIWSMVQAGIEGRVVCASGHTGEVGTPSERANDLASALQNAGIPGPYELVAAGDGVHTVRVFADGRDDVSGVVLVEPIPLGFQDFYDGTLGEEFGHPAWLDLDPTVADTLTDLGNAPLVILRHDPRAVFLADRFVDGAGEGEARALSDYWEQGVDFYAGLSTDSRGVVVPDTGFEGVLWFHPEMIMDAIVRTTESDS